MPKTMFVFAPFGITCRSSGRPNVSAIAVRHMHTNVRVFYIGVAGRCSGLPKQFLLARVCNIYGIMLTATGYCTTVRQTDTHR